MTAPVPPKNDWVAEDTPGHTSTDWEVTPAVMNNVADNIRYLLAQVGKIGSVAVLGTPVAGQAIVATSPTSATWQDVATVGGPADLINDGTGLFIVGAAADLTDDGTGLFTINAGADLTNDGTGLYSIGA